MYIMCVCIYIYIYIYIYTYTHIKGSGQTGSSQKCRDSPNELSRGNVGEMWQYMRTESSTWQNVGKCGPSVKTQF